jgi:hypothetical protein
MRGKIEKRATGMALFIVRGGTIAMPVRLTRDSLLSATSDSNRDIHEYYDL